MLILSWNVAGLSTTVNRIHEAYGNTNNNDKKNQAGGEKKQQRQQPAASTALLKTFFERHGADIVCLQEHKIPRSQLSNRCEPRQCSSVDDYESFWSCCVDSKKKGLNGVVTYARRGTVLTADASPLGSADLDDQGRCVKTDHGAFVLFNVYVPASGGQPLAYKMKFLNALRRAMQRERRCNNKPVILVGDLNISHAKADVHWEDRTVHVDDVLEEVAASLNNGDNNNANNNEEGGGNNNNNNKKGGGGGNELPQWKNDLARHWPAIEAALGTKEVVPITTKNPLTSEEHQKYRLAVTVNGNKRRLLLGKHEPSPEYCLYNYEFDGGSYIDADTDEQVVAQEKNAVRLRVLAELMAKIVGVAWDEGTLRRIASSDDATIQRASPPRGWLTAVLEEDGMVDAFRHYYPDAEARFTCWHQFKNCRYENEGGRIDMTLVDRSLLQSVQKGAVNGLRCCSEPPNDNEKTTSQPPEPQPEPQQASGEGEKQQQQRQQQQQQAEDGTKKPHHLTEAAALAAATANGRFQPVSFQGGGIQAVSTRVLDTQFGVPHTGMIYTPPSFSDHIGISLLLDDRLVPGDQTLDDKDAPTRKAQPHKQQKTLASFFGSTSSSSSNGEPAASTNGKETTVQAGTSRSAAGGTTLTTNNKRPRLSSNTKGKSAAAASKKKAPVKNSIMNQLRAQPRAAAVAGASMDGAAAPNGGGGISAAANKRPSAAASSSSSSKAGKAAAAGGKVPPKNSILNHFQRRPKGA